MIAYNGHVFCALTIRPLSAGKGAPATLKMMNSYCRALTVRGLKGWPLELIN